MTPRMLGNLLALTYETERRIRAAGRTPPPRQYLMAVLAPHAKTVTRAALALATAEEQAGRALALARECAKSALETAGAVADACIEATPPAERAAFDPAAMARFDPAKHTVMLVTNPGAAAPLNAGDLS